MQVGKIEEAMEQEDCKTEPELEDAVEVDQKPKLKKLGATKKKRRPAKEVEAQRKQLLTTEQKRKMQRQQLDRFKTI